MVMHHCRTFGAISLLRTIHALTGVAINFRPCGPGRRTSESTLEI